MIDVPKLVNKAVLRVLVDKNMQVPAGDLMVVWTSKVLQNWKGLVAVKGSPLYFEVTHNGNTGETYVDIYKKETVCILK